MRLKWNYETALGKIMIVEEDHAIVMVSRLVPKEYEEVEKRETTLIKEAGKQLQEYFKGTRKSFDLPLNPKGTDFQKRVWKALQEIPYGETRSYKEIAQAVENPKGARAVGMANNKNPMMIIIPCHRVIGANGTLVGYAGGLSIKETLLALEKKENKG
ncbi:MAG: methylated-DNA--[protein]-cysteine S-methyltransferase [Eubacteriaceae bacterium]